MKPNSSRFGAPRTFKEPAAHDAHRGLSLPVFSRRSEGYYNGYYQQQLAAQRAAQLAAQQAQQAAMVAEQIATVTLTVAPNTVENLTRALSDNRVPNVGISLSQANGATTIRVNGESLSLANGQLTFKKMTVSRTEVLSALENCLEKVGMLTRIGETLRNFDSRPELGNQLTFTLGANGEIRMRGKATVEIDPNTVSQKESAARQLGKKMKDAVVNTVPRTLRRLATTKG